MDLKRRFWEIDFLRGIAIVMMVIFHTLYMLDYFNVHAFNISSGFWFLFARMTAVVFLVLVGISLTLSYSRASQNVNFSKYAKRGLTIFSFGMLITLITWIFVPKSFVIFGVLHFIGVAIMLSYLFLKFRYVNLALSVAFITIGFLIQNIVVSVPWLLPFGLAPARFYTLDYFPIFPWFGVVLIGIFLGNTLYLGYNRRFKLANLSKFAFIRALCFLGRHSLLIYVTHVPVIISVLCALGTACL